MFWENFNDPWVINNQKIIESEAREWLAREPALINNQKIIESAYAVELLEDIDVGLTIKR